MYEMYRLQKGMVWLAEKGTEKYRFEEKNTTKVREMEGNGTAGYSYVERNTPLGWDSINSGTPVQSAVKRNALGSWEREGNGTAMYRYLHRKEWSGWLGDGKEAVLQCTALWKGMVQEVGRGKGMGQEEDRSSKWLVQVYICYISGLLTPQLSVYPPPPPHRKH